MTSALRAVLVPPVPALLPGYASIADPVAELRSAASGSVAWLVRGAPARVAVLWSRSAGVSRSGSRAPVDLRVARSLLDAVGYGGELVAAEQPGPVPDRTPYLVLANGCAEPYVRQPAPPDPRAAGLDEAVERAVRAADADALLSLDAELGEQLFASGLPALHALGRLVAQHDSRVHATVRYDGAPYLIRYWVAELHAD